jgi:uridylate kinase
MVGMKKIVISLGGSVLVPTLEENRISRYVRIISRIAEVNRVFIVTGGGGEARRYITAAAALGVDQGTADEIGISVTRLNALLLNAALGDRAYPRIATDQTEALEFAQSGKVVVMGGVTPAQTTDAVSAVLAERVGADLLINATSVDGVYSADPRIDPNAVRYAHITPGDLLEIVKRDRLDAGSNSVMDMVAVKVVVRSSIPLIVLDGRDPENLLQAVITGRFAGTTVSVDERPLLPL